MLFCFVQITSRVQYASKVQPSRKQDVKFSMMNCYKKSTVLQNPPLYAGNIFFVCCFGIYSAILLTTYIKIPFKIFCESWAGVGNHSFVTKNVIVRPTIITKDLCKASTQMLSMISYSCIRDFMPNLPKKILNGI